MDNRIVVFLGPSLPQEQARNLLQAHYAAPADQGDIVEAVQLLRPRIIVLIDGAFGSVPTVRHKEILWALAQGVEIFGASSLGALRAAELAGYGMRGYGLIYRWYRSVPFAEDDEVAVAMAPPELGAGALGDALIDMRITFNRAVRAGIVPPNLREHLVGIARSTHFLERSYSHVLTRAEAEIPAQYASSLRNLQAWLRDHTISQKRIDAIGLLRQLAMRAGTRMTEAVRAPRFQLTEAFVRDLEDAGFDIGRLGAQRW
ncbi:TfuA-like protein [Microvirga sp. VF16]|uniref:TfuA-like protein n=1 Tax=Microvirga sp. VF16 TaxID=2807101 RepID=UPI00193D33F7|nr:TfuA-like protein [Microvirga sp. VF16]QRM29963.1 TfuA-like protein [Microvirga sp. VF16]